MRGEEVLKRILLSGRLEDKLFGEGLAYSELDWKLKAGLTAIPDAPGREGRLRPDQAKSRGFPKRSELNESTGRGHLLHFFANHELLAIETMAYVLLRFPDAPESFRAGVFRTIQDEQRHMSLYIARMRELGVEFGDLPLNLYFWNSLKEMRSPLDFVIQMSLTFEQANLDFALEYASLLEKEVGDLQTAELLNKVHEDEIKHVAHGLKWFKEWRTMDSPQRAGELESEFESYARLLPFPMTPRRARGNHYFSTEARKETGMSDEFIESVRIAGGSRGKVPDFYFFNPQCEIENRLPTLSESLKAKMDDLAPLLVWLASEEDVVQLRSRPEIAWLSEVHRFKGELPEIVTSEEQLDRYIAFDRFMPWGFGESAWKKYASLKEKVRKKPPFSKTLHRDKLFSKVYWKEVLQLEERNDTEEVLIKSDQSTSGRGHLRVPREHLLDSGFQQKLELRKKRAENYVIEPFYKKVQDFSVQYEIFPDGRVKEFDARAFQVDANFQYQGSFFGKPLPVVAVERPMWSKVHARVIAHLKSLQYVGPLGIDMMVHEVNGEHHVVPVIEVNARFTMGRVAIAIEEAITGRAKTVNGSWVFVNESSLIHHGCRNFSELEQKLRREHGDSFLATTPSASARFTWTYALAQSNRL